MVKKYCGEQCEMNSEQKYVTAEDYDFERAKVDRLQAALVDAIRLIDETTYERKERVQTLRHLADIKR